MHPVLPQLPAHLLQDPYVAALDRQYRASWNYDIAFARRGSSYPFLKDEASRVLKRTCVGCHPIAQGGFNTVFLLTFDDQTDLIARVAGVFGQLPLPAHVLAQQLSSEVATLKFLLARTSIPVPIVYHVDLNPDNAVGAPYMIMSRIHGIPASNMWPTMSLSQKIDLVTDVAKIEADLRCLPFHELGCLLDSNGTVGPMVHPSTATATLREPHCGPFSSVHALIEAHIRSELLVIHDRSSWVEQRTLWQNVNGGVADISAAYATVWFALLLYAIRALPVKECEDPVWPFTLCHDDLSLGNILVSLTGNLVGLVDWQGSQVRPPCNLISPNRHFLLEPDSFMSEGEREPLLRARANVLLERTPQPEVDQAPLRPAELLQCVSSGHSTLSRRSTLDMAFATWFLETDKAEVDPDLLELFMPLMTLIMHW